MKKVISSLSRKVEVDVSGAVAQTAVDSAFAYSNGKNYSVLISAKIKKQALKYFRLFSNNALHENFYFKLYIAGLTLLLERIPENYDIILDTELYHQDEKIKTELFKIIGHELNISFKQIGRKSNAHFLAKGTFLEIKKPHKIVGLEDLKRLLVTKKRPALQRSKLLIR